MDVILERVTIACSLDSVVGVLFFNFEPSQQEALLALSRRQASDFLGAYLSKNAAPPPKAGRPSRDGLVEATRQACGLEMAERVEQLLYCARTNRVFPARETPAQVRTLRTEILRTCTILRSLDVPVPDEVLEALMTLSDDWWQDSPTLEEELRDAIDDPDSAWDEAVIPHLEEGNSIGVICRGIVSAPRELAFLYHWQRKLGVHDYRLVKGFMIEDIARRLGIDAAASQASFREAFLIY